MAYVPTCSPRTVHQSRPSLCHRRRTSSFSGRQLRTSTLAFQCTKPSRNVQRMAISTNDFRPGTTVEVDRIVYRVVESLHVKPGKGAAFVRTKIKNMKTGNTVDKTFKAGEMVTSAVLDKVPMQHTYLDGSDFVFMNMQTYEEERLTAAQLGETVTKFMSEGLEVEVLMHNDDILAVDIPTTMTFTVTQTDPGVKGNTAQGGGSKPAVIETGAEIMVPLFITTGEKIKVNTETSKYTGRANE